MSWLYVITHVASGRVYVGQTSSTPAKRWQGHIGEAYKRKLSGSRTRTKFHNAIRKYGPDAFAITWTKQVDPDLVGYYERRMIDSLAAADRDKGFNTTEGGEGAPLTAEARLKLSASMQRARCDPEVLQHYRDAATQRWSDPTYRERQTAALSAAHRGRKQSEQWVEKRVAANRGRKRTPEQRARMAEAQRQRREREAKTSC